ncbi:MAG: hypothetical protein IPL26_27590 [Leptospiraceae bacterium]|nr:hypothetical protein [Leptospiraceae bacterium]
MNEDLENEDLELFNNTASSMIKNMNSPAMQKIMEDFRRLYNPYGDIFASLNRALESIKYQNLGTFSKLIESQRNMLAPLSVQSDLFKALNESMSWQKQFSLNESFLNSIKGFDNKVNQQFAKNLLAINISWGLIDYGFASKVSDSILKSNLLSTYQNLSNSYIGLTEIFADSKNNIFTLPDYYSLGATKEYAIASQSYFSISEIREGSEELTIHESFEEENLVEICYSVPKILENINKKFIILWNGAHEALTSNNPDRIRHASVSIRELLTHLIHTLSPEDKMKDWSKDPNHFVNGKPTRSARMSYILREINTPQLKDFVEKDIKACVELLNCFQNGTHSLESKLTENQLKILIVRVGAFIQYLFAIISP